MISKGFLILEVWALGELLPMVAVFWVTGLRLIVWDSAELCCGLNTLAV